jgi:hypothetical protein
MEFAQAERLTDTLLRDMWRGRERAELKLPPSMLMIEAGDLLELPGAAPERLIAERIEDGESRALALRRVDERGPAPLGASRREPPKTQPLWGAPEVRVIELAPPDGEAPHAPRLAVFADPWPGLVAVHAATEGGGFRLATTLTGRATVGRLTAPLFSGPDSRFDLGNNVWVELFGGALASLPDIDVFAGGNAAAVMTAGGRWEILQFAEAELIGPKQYRLTRLLRGQLGSELAMASGADTGADFVLLDRAIAVLPLRSDQLGLPLNYRIGPARDDHAAPSFTALTVAAQGTGLRPFAPTHIDGRRDAGSGDIEINWIRRTRVGGDSWEAVEVPLGESAERYEIDILDGGEVVRTLAAATPSASYTAAQQTADFGGLPSPLDVVAYQVSPEYGRGQGRAATLWEV